jgi:hypothetical protein
VYSLKLIFFEEMNVRCLMMMLCATGIIGRLELWSLKRRFNAVKCEEIIL